MATKVELVDKGTPASSFLLILWKEEEFEVLSSQTLHEVSLVKCCHMASSNKRLQTVVRLIGSSFVQNNAYN